MDNEQLQSQLIEVEIEKACGQHGADVSKIGDVLRKEAIVVEHDGKAVVSVKVDDASGLPHLSPAFSGDVPLSLAERVKELKDSGRYADSFKRPEPQAKSSRPDNYEGFTGEELLFRLQPGAAMDIAKRVDPTGRPVREKPARRKAAEEAGSGKLTETEMLTLSPSEVMNKARGL